ncbi:receptor-type adenylate cyclase b [Strigomonas culicis]|uniref:Receptor-type adenylate cyclase b n=1 Tax=Strigomonas culicis TaxID=28005 RepID=S9U7C2_9TRYP|nr:receptor-type adenylate cyclase b [Strigomonas culicis]|eukprot:EPY24808.1 receptor-type adenylate cyclase b [Strigomonas culicis]
MYFLRADPYSEKLVLLKYATSHINARRIGYMQLTSAAFGDELLALTQRVLSEMGRDAPLLYLVPPSDTLNQTAFDAFANGKPQVIIVDGAIDAHTMQFVEQCLTDPRTKDAVLLVSSGLSELVYSVYAALASAGAITPVDMQVVMSSTNILPTETSYNHIRVFTQEMDKWIADGNSVYSDSDPNIYTTSVSIGEMMVAGWLVGKVVLQTLNRPAWTTSRSAYMKGVFEQNRYVVEGDFVLGDYGGACDYADVATSQGAVCSCNQGGRTTYLKHLDADLQLRFFSDMNLNYPNAQCGASAYQMPQPVSLVSFKPTDNAVMSAEFDYINEAVNAAINAANNANLIFHIGTFSGAMGKESTLYGEHVSAHVTDVFFGVTSTTFDTGDTLMMNPVHPYPAPNPNSSNIVTLVPTLEQQLFVLYAFFEYLIQHGSVVTSSTPIALVTKGLSESQESVVEIVRKTAITFGLREASLREVVVGTCIVGGLHSSGVNVVVGFETGDAVGVASFLQENPDALVVLTYADFTLYYGELLSAFSLVSVDVQARFYTLTSLPLWTDNSSSAHAASRTLRAYHAIVTNSSEWNPRGLETYAMFKFVSTLARLTTAVNCAQLRSALYLNSNNSTDHTTYEAIRRN